MNKTIYLRDEEGPIWERARELAGDKLSPVIVRALKRYIAEKEAQEAEVKGFERIEISFIDADAHNIPKMKAFHGKWIFPRNKPADLWTEDESTCYHYALAITAKGNVVVFSWVEDRESLGGWRFRVFPSLEAAAADRDTNFVARKAIQAIGVPIEELDI